MQMLIGGRPVGAGSVVEVRNPFDGSVVDTVPAGHRRRGRTGALRGSGGRVRWRRGSRASSGPPCSRGRRRLLEERRRSSLTLLIASESGKTLREARGEVGARRPDVPRLRRRRPVGWPARSCRSTGRRPARDRFGFTLRVPVGVVVAITPFNFPLNLAAHKVAPGDRGRERRDPEAGERHTADGHRARADPVRGGSAAGGALGGDRARAAGGRRARHAIRDRAW